MTRIDQLRQRFAAGMAKGTISAEDWEEEFLPMLEDSPRLDWIADCHTEYGKLDIVRCPTGFIVSRTTDDGDSWVDSGGDTLRKAIDSARTPTKE